MADNTGGVSFKVGLVHAAKPGFAQVAFPDLDGLVSGWLPVVAKKTHKDKECCTLDSGEQVACVLDEYFENGVVLGAVYSDADQPPVESADKRHFRFFDGGSFEYDRSSGTLTIITTGPVDITAAGQVKVKAPSVILDSPSVTCTGDLLVEGKLTYRGGLTGSGGGSSAAAIEGNITATGQILDSGGNSNHHNH